MANTWLSIWNLVQGHWVQQLYHSMANMNIYKSHTRLFFAISHRLGAIKMLNFWPLKYRLNSWRRKTCLSRPMFEFVLLNFFKIILAAQQHTTMNDFTFTHTYIFSDWPSSTNINNYQPFALSTQCTTYLTHSLWQKSRFHLRLNPFLF